MRPYDLGWDVEEYKNIYQNIEYFEYSIEPFFYYLGLFGNTFGLDFRFILIIYAILSILLKEYGVYIYTKNLSYTTFFVIFYAGTFLWLYDVSQLRASILLGIIPFYFYCKSKLVKILIITFAILNHYSGFLLIPLVLFDIYKKNKITFVLTSVIIFIFLYIYNIYEVVMLLLISRYGEGGANNSAYIYFLHPKILIPLTFTLYLLLKNEENLPIDNKLLANISFFLLVTNFVAIFFIITGSNIVGFRFAEIGFYITFYFSYILYVNSHKYIYALFFISVILSFILTTFIFNIEPIIHLDVLSRYIL